MKIIAFILVVICAVSLAFSQEAKPTPELYSVQTLSDLQKIQKEALTDDFALDQIAYLTYNIGPRLSGSPQAQRAVEYVADEMRKLGLDVRLQKVMVPHWVRGIETGELTEWNGMAKGTTQKVVLTALGGSVATPENGLTANIVVVGGWDELNALGRKGVEGKIVLFNTKFDRELAASGFGGNAYGQAVQFRGGGPVAAAKLGAVAVLVRSAGGSQNRLAHAGATRYADGVEKIPAAAVTFEDAEMIAHLAKMGDVKIKLVLTPKTLPDVESFNVIADLKGSEKPDEVVIVSGHLDSWDLGTGAIDDAAGVAVSMQVPYLLKKLNMQPKRTIRFIAWMNEENGSRGGDAYFEEQKNNLSKQFAAIEADLGSSHPLGYLFAGNREAMPYFTPLTNILRSQGASLGQYQPGGVAEDINRLTEKGVPSFAPYFNTQTYFNYHHTAADTFDKVDPKQLGEVNSVMAVLAYGLANLEQPLPR